MRTWHVFYDDNKNIIWTADAGVTQAIVNKQAEENLNYITVDQTDVLDANRYYVNDDENGVILKSTFTPTISTYNPAIETAMSITNLPTGTEVYVANVLKATISDTSVNLTFNDPGEFEILLKKAGYFDYAFTIVTARAS